MTLAVAAAIMVLLLLAAAIITGNLLRALEEGRAVEMLILVVAVTLMVLAATVLVAEVRAAERRGAAVRAAAALAAERSPTTIRVTEMIRAIQTRTTPAEAAALTEQERASE